MRSGLNQSVILLLLLSLAGCGGSHPQINGGIVISMVLSLIITPAVHFYLTRKDTESSNQELKAT